MSTPTKPATTEVTLQELGLNIPFRFRTDRCDDKPCTWIKKRPGTFEAVHLCWYHDRYRRQPPAQGYRIIPTTHYDEVVPMGLAGALHHRLETDE